MAGGRGLLDEQSVSVSPPILNFEGGGEGELEGELDGGESQESQKVQLRAVRKPPSQNELEEHMTTHLPYRTWCKHCVSGRGLSEHHRKKLRGLEQEVPVISIYYAYLGSSEDKEGERVQPIIVLKDRKQGTIRAHMVEEKGVNAYAVKRISQDIGLMGYKQIIFKSFNIFKMYLFLQGGSNEFKSSDSSSGKP